MYNNISIQVWFGQFFFDQIVTLKWIGDFRYLSIYLNNNVFLLTKKDTILIDRVYSLLWICAVCENIDGIHKKIGTQLYVDFYNSPKK